MGYVVFLAPCTGFASWSRLRFIGFTTCKSRAFAVRCERDRDYGDVIVYVASSSRDISTILQRNSVKPSALLRFVVTYLFIYPSPSNQISACNCGTTVTCNPGQVTLRDTTIAYHMRDTIFDIVDVGAGVGPWFKGCHAPYQYELSAKPIELFTNPYLGPIPLC